MPVIVRAPCPGFPGAAGCYDWTTQTVYVKPGADRFAYKHELGHAFDDVMLSGGERNRFRTLTHQRGAQWWKLATDELGAYARSSVGEQFADAYANCALHNGTWRRRDGVIEQRWETSTTYAPSPSVHRAVCSFIARAARA
jgi:hypothetical protein